jgi:DNA-directed RNA polymerase subunit F
MVESKLIEMKPLSLYEVKEIIKDKKGEKELNYEQEITMKYVDKFSKLTKKQTEDLLEKLDEIEVLKESTEIKYQIVAALPTSIEQVKLFMPKDKEVSDEDLKKILELTKKLGEKE